MKKSFSILLFSWILLFSSCAVSKLEKSLTPAHREFLSQARFTISKQERKAFLNLPPSERDKFIEDFWKKRDPDPDTDLNEFKVHYFERIDEANCLFSSMGAPGWLQDRGRIYILLGRPDERETYPRGRSLYDPPFEIWYYGFFPIVFIDKNWTGDYVLEPSSAMQIALINEAQMARKPQFPQIKNALDFTSEIKKSKPDEIFLLATVPYKNIWFSAEGSTLKTTLRLSLEITELDEKHQEKKKIREEHKDFPLVFQDKSWLENIGKAYVMQLSVSGLPKGVYSLLIKIRNEVDGSQVYKKEIITL
jgi:GWxTD domain-containing protein